MSKIVGDSTDQPKRFCKNCGTTLPRHARCCPKCGLIPGLIPDRRK